VKLCLIRWAHISVLLVIFCRYKWKFVSLGVERVLEWLLNCMRVSLRPWCLGACDLGPNTRWWSFLSLPSTHQISWVWYCTVCAASAPWCSCCIPILVVVYMDHKVITNTKLFIQDPCFPGFSSLITKRHQTFIYFNSLIDLGCRIPFGIV
jgi:hypothetical protein